MNEHAEPEIGRAIGLDMGSKRIGVAITDDRRLVVTPYDVLIRSGNQPEEHDRIAKLVEETTATVVVVGLPTSLDGSEGPASKLVKDEVSNLRRRLDIDVELFDERFTTTVADQLLNEANVAGRKKRKRIDATAASLILRSWLGN